jgi:hypothetical protein
MRPDVSGDILVLSTKEEWPVSVATAPEPSFPDGIERTS